MRRKFRTFVRVIKTGLLNFVRNASLAAAAIAVMVVTLTIVLFSIIASATFNHTIAQITDKINVSIYLKDGITDEQRNTLIDGLKKQPNVKAVRYVSKQDALDSYRASNAGNTQLLQAINETGNPLPASIQVDPLDPSRIDSIRTYAERSENKTLLDPRTPISYSGSRKEAIDNISHATGVLSRIGVGAVLVFTFISMLIIFNTIQMAIFNRRDELTIMRLLGATTWFIRGPFVVESIIYGIISAGVSMLLMYGAFVTTASTLQASSLGLLDIAYANTYFQQSFWSLLTLQLTVGIVIGAVSSIIATRRYLKFKIRNKR